MSELIKGIHHVSMKCCTPEEYAEEKDFYGRVLGLPLLREWARGVMFDTGAGVIEIFSNGEAPAEKGIIGHFAFFVKDADACAARVRECGYEVFDGPRDVVLQAAEPYPVRVAFCRGPLGEEIEFFAEREA